MTSRSGSADEPRAARYILKDYVNGKLLYVNPPPKEATNKMNGYYQIYKKVEFSIENYIL